MSDGYHGIMDAVKTNIWICFSDCRPLPSTSSTVCITSQLRYPVNLMQCLDARHLNRQPRAQMELMNVFVSSTWTVLGFVSGWFRPDTGEDRPIE